MKGRQIAFSIVGTVMFFLFTVICLTAFFQLNAQKDEAATGFLVASIVFLVLFICNIVFGLTACKSRFSSVMLLIMAIIGLPLGGVLGIFNLFSYIYSRKYLKGEYVMNAVERGKMRRESHRERRREERERRAYDPEYNRFVKTLKARKFYAVCKNLFILALTALHSIPGFLLILETTKDESSVIFMIIGYLVLCPITLFLKGVDPFFSYDYTRDVTTYKTEYVGDSWAGDEMRFRTEASTNREYHTGRFITIPGLLYYLVGWAVCFTQAIGVLISLFVSYKSRRTICGRSVRKIPREFLSLGIAGSFVTYFLFSCVFVREEYLDYLEQTLS